MLGKIYRPSSYQQINPEVIAEMLVECHAMCPVYRPSSYQQINPEVIAEMLVECHAMCPVYVSGI